MSGSTMRFATIAFVITFTTLALISNTLKETAHAPQNPASPAKVACSNP